MAFQWTDKNGYQNLHMRAGNWVLPDFWWFWQEQAMCVKSYYSLEIEQESLHEFALELDDICTPCKATTKGCSYYKVTFLD